jgi:predicted RNA-binding protein YlqC (UPF0109 family)
MSEGRMKELVAYMAQALVDHPEEVRVEEVTGARSIVYELHVAPSDMGRVIGKNGRVANAMRSLLRVASTRSGKRAILEIVE